MAWLTIGPAATIPAGEYVQLEIGATTVAVYNIDGNFYAVEDVCTHDGGGLAGGCLDGDVVICPRHGARFCLRTGAPLSPPAYEPIRTFVTRVVDGVLEVSDT
jgi:3-phenylpropionate/trans-cinnamate dioxygenase ferredoxin subunit